MHPTSPYGCAKLLSYSLVRNYRKAFSIFASNGILFNHESPRRGETFVSRKIVKSLVRISKGSNETLILGNINAIRDWGHASEYVELMWRILQLDEPVDLVIATGRSYTVKYFVNLVAETLNLDLSWHGVGIDEVAVNTQGRIIIKIDKGYFRPLEVDNLEGDPSQAMALLNWTPKIELIELVHGMIESELRLTL
jgi:GDPmannose 4,6-dehydratase